MDGYPKAMHIVGLTHRLESISHPFGIAVFAAWTDLAATSDGIPSGLGPLNS